jgi:long-subunit fatty acid transport protein
LSAFHRINDKWDVMGTVEFYQWNVLDAYYFKNIVNFGDKVVEQNYHNTWTFAVGSYYHWTDDFYVAMSSSSA